MVNVESRLATTRDYTAEVNTLLSPLFCNCGNRLMPIVAGLSFGVVVFLFDPSGKE
jgi:hypothetical protein